MNQDYHQLPYAASILFQGYYIASALKQGLDEIVCDGEVIVSQEIMLSARQHARDMSKEDPKKFFDMFRNREIISSEVYRSACEQDESIKNDKKVKDIFDRLERGDFELSIDDAVYASKRILPKCFR